MTGGAGHRDGLDARRTTRRSAAARSASARPCRSCCSSCVVHHLLRSSSRAPTVLAERRGRRDQMSRADARGPGSGVVGSIPIVALRARRRSCGSCRCRSNRATTSTTGSSARKLVAWTNYRTVFQTDICSSRAAAQLDRHLPHRHHHRGRARHPGRVRHRAPRLPGQALVLSRALAIAMFPAISIVTPLFNLWRQHRPLRHLARPDHPVPVVHAAAGDLDAVGVLPADPVGAGAGGPGRRRDLVAGVPQGHRAAGGARASSPRRS